LCRRRHGSNR